MLNHISIPAAADFYDFLNGYFRRFPSLAALMVVHKTELIEAGSDDFPEAVRVHAIEESTGDDYPLTVWHEYGHLIWEI